MASSLPTSSFILSLFIIITTLTVTVTSRIVHISRAEETKLHFWYHEIRTGPNLTRINVVATNLTSGFGGINVADNSLTTGTDVDSMLIGRAQGITVRASVDGSTGWTSLNFIFISGEFNGSSVTILGPFLATGITERSIVGGTGQFRMARGFAVNDAVISTSYGVKAEFNITVWHYPSYF